MRKQQMAKFLYLKRRTFMTGVLERHSHQMSPMMPATKEKGEEANEVRGEPVVLLPLIEHHLHAAHGDGEQTEA